MAAGADGLRRFFVDALTGALDVGLAVPDDVLRHVTPDVLAAHLPRPLWGKLLAACLAAPRTDARLVVDTVGVPALCEHVPGAILWSIVADVAARALGKGLVAAPPPAPVATAPSTAPVAASAPTPAPVAPVSSGPVSGVPTPVTAGPASAPIPAPISAAERSAAIAAAAKAAPTPTPRATSSIPAMKPATPTPPVAATTAAAAAAVRATTVTTTTATPAPPPSAVVDIDFDDDDEPPPLEAPPVSHRAATVPGPAARGTPPPPSNGGRSSNAGASSRRPQASAPARTTGRQMPASPRRGANSDFDLDTDVGTTTGKPEDVAVEDDLVDWSTSEETVTSGDNPLRKR